MSAFTENCDKFDQTLWAYDNVGSGYTSKAPTPDGAGHWVFDFPLGQAYAIIAMYTKQDLGYGIYELTFKMSGAHPGPNPASCHYYMYLIHNVPSPNYMELDMFEVEGNYTPKQQSISNYRGSATNNHYAYWTSTINYEDGNWHKWRCEYSASAVKLYVDDVLQFTFSELSPAVLPLPPMTLLFGASCDGTQATHWTMTVDKFTYTPPTAAQTYTLQLVDGAGGTLDTASPYIGAGNYNIPINTGVFIHAVASSGYQWTGWNYWINGAATPLTDPNPDVFMSGTPNYAFKIQPVFAAVSNPCQAYIDQIATLQTQVTSLNAQIATLTSANAALTAKLAAANTQIASLQAKITKAITDLS